MVGNPGTATNTADRVAAFSVGTVTGSTFAGVASDLITGRGGMNTLAAAVGSVAATGAYAVGQQFAKAHCDRVCTSP